MAVNTALPIAHDATSIDTTPVVIGRRFQQPVDLGVSGETSLGMEIWLKDKSPDNLLYAMFGGTLSYQAETADRPACLTITPISTMASSFTNIGILEPAPVTIVYENAEEAAIYDQMINLITTSYAYALGDSTQSHWHLTMRATTDKGGSTQIIKDYLDAAGAGLPTAIQGLVTDFMASTSTLPVKAGDCIGAAGIGSPWYEITADAETELVDATDAEDDGDGPLTTAATARCVTIITQIYNDEYINPAYYLWAMLRQIYYTGDNNFNLLTRLWTDYDTETSPADADESFDQPLLVALGLELATPVLARAYCEATMPNRSTSSTVILYPIGTLANWGGASGNGYDHKAKPRNSVYVTSSYEWRITDDANLDFEARDSGSSAAVTAVTTTSTTRIQTTWTSWGSAINDICEVLQVPIEIGLATVTHESGSDERACAMENYLSGQKTTAQSEARSAANGDAALEADYLNYVDWYDGLSRRHGHSVPSLDTNGGDAILGTTSLTWDNLVTLLSFSKTTASRVSPGLMQTLITTADGKESIGAIRNWYGSDAAAYFGVDALPAAGDWGAYFVWLLTGRNSLLAGLTYHKMRFSRGRSRFDIPRIGGCYNHGSIGYLQTYDDDAAVTNPWALWAVKNYVTDLATLYNQAQNFLATGTQDPSIRFWRNEP